MDRRHLNYSPGQPLRPVGIQGVSSGESEDTPKNKDSDISLQGIGWCPPADHPQFHSQRATLYGDHFSSVMASAPAASDSVNEYMPGAPEEFSNRQIHINGPGSYQRIVPELQLRRTGVRPQQQEASSSSIPWEGNARVCHHPNAITNPPHDDMSLFASSGQWREGTQCAVPKDVQQDQHADAGSISDSKDENKEIWEQYRCENCGRQYRRAQELRRHTRDKHEQQPQCPFCYATWSRPEKIRAHLITEHGDRFTEEQNQELHDLRGRRKTIHFIAKCATPTPPP